MTKDELKLKQEQFRKETEIAKFEAFSLMCQKVAELEAEVKEWKDKADLWCKTANLKDHNIMINKELVQENAELKERAKSIIEDLKALYFSPVVTKNDLKRQDKILAEAEQFLKDNA